MARTERKLLKKVDFLQYRKERNVRDIQIMRKYYVQRREDLTKWVLGTSGPVYVYMYACVYVCMHICVYVCVCEGLVAL